MAQASIVELLCIPYLSYHLDIAKNDIFLDQHPWNIPKTKGVYSSSWRSALIQSLCFEMNPKALII